MFNLIVEFDGLCAFVPSRDRYKMKVLFINALDGGHNHADHEMPMPPHFTFIGFPVGSLLPPSSAQVVVNRGINGTEGIRFLEWQDIEFITGVPRPRRLSIAGGRIPGSAEPRFLDKDENDFSWLVDLGQIDPELGEVDPLCLAPDPPRNKVLARLSLNHGEIFTHQLAGSRTTEPFIWEFRTSDGKEVSPCCQALAQAVRWKVRVSAPYVTVRLWPFSGSPSADLRFAPTVGSELILSLRNIPADAMLGLDRIGYPTDLARYHFPLLSKVAKRQSVRSWVPWIVAQRTSPGGGVRAGSTLCIGGSFSG